MSLNDHSFEAETTSFGGSSKEAYHFEDRKWFKMSISWLSLAIKAKLCILHTANNEVIPSVSKKPKPSHICQSATSVCQLVRIH